MSTSNPHKEEAARLSCRLQVHQSPRQARVVLVSSTGRYLVAQGATVREALIDARRVLEAHVGHVDGMLERTR